MSIWTTRGLLAALVLAAAWLWSRTAGCKSIVHGVLVVSHRDLMCPVDMRLLHLPCTAPPHICGQHEQAGKQCVAPFFNRIPCLGAVPPRTLPYMQLQRDLDDSGCLHSKHDYLQNTCPVVLGYHLHVLRLVCADCWHRSGWQEPARDRGGVLEQGLTNTSVQQCSTGGLHGHATMHHVVHVQCSWQTTLPDVLVETPRRAGCAHHLDCSQSWWLIVTGCFALPGVFTTLVVTWNNIAATVAFIRCLHIHHCSPGVEP